MWKVLRVRFAGPPAFGYPGRVDPARSQLFLYKGYANSSGRITPGGMPGEGTRWGGVLDPDGDLDLLRLRPLPPLVGAPRDRPRPRPLAGRGDPVGGIPSGDKACRSTSTRISVYTSREQSVATGLTLVCSLVAPLDAMRRKEVVGGGWCRRPGRCGVEALAGCTGDGPVHHIGPVDTTLNLTLASIDMLGT